MRSFAIAAALIAGSSTVSAGFKSRTTEFRRDDDNNYNNYGQDDNNNYGNNYGGNDNGGSTGTLSQNVLCTGCQQDGQGANGSEAGQVASLTSNENFINFCAGSDGGPSSSPITNGVQITSGSCNPIPMGVIAATTNMPSAKFLAPKNLDTINANEGFTIQMQINNLVTGSFVNPNTNYYSAPCFTDGSGNVVGHSHVTVEQISDLQTTQLTDPTQFAFFKGLNEAAQNGILSVAVDGGLPAGTYRLSSINSCANHQPVLVAVAQRGSLDDAVYFTVSDGGDNSGNNYGNYGDNQDDNNNNYGHKRQVAQEEKAKREVEAPKQAKRMRKTSSRRLSKRRMDLERAAN